MRVQVEDSHIGYGRPKRPTGCPISLAVHEHVWKTTGKVVGVSIKATYCSINGKRYRLDDTGLQFMRDFDAGMKVEETVVELMEVA